MKARLLAVLGASLFSSLHHDTALASSFRMVCGYEMVASSKGLKNESFKLEFAYDDITSRGVLIGNNGLADVEAFVGKSGITFAEKLVTGAIQTTTITSTGESVHSRHSILSGSLIPTQYYGKCITTIAGG